MSSKGKRCSEIIVIKNAEDFDRQEDYQWIAKSISDGKYHVGYIYVDKPWYSPESEWTYYLKYQVNTSDYGSQHWEECIVDKNSIKPYTIRNKVWLNNLRDIDTVFVTSDYIISHSENDILGTNIDEVINKLNQNKINKESTTITYIGTKTDTFTFYQCNDCDCTDVLSDSYYCPNCGKKLDKM